MGAATSSSLWLIRYSRVQVALFLSIPWSLLSTQRYHRPQKYVTHYPERARKLWSWQIKVDSVLLGSSKNIRSLISVFACSLSLSWSRIMTSYSISKPYFIGFSSWLPTSLGLWRETSWKSSRRLCWFSIPYLVTIILCVGYLLSCRLCSGRSL